MSGSGGDILFRDGSNVTFRPGERSKSIALVAVNDMIPENVETYTISLAVDHSMATVVNSVRQVVVRKSDTPIRFLQVGG